MPDWKMPFRINEWAVDHKNNRLVAIAGQGVFFIDIASGKLQSPPEGFLSIPRSTISADGRFVAVCDTAGVIRVWDAPFTGKPRTLREGGDTVDDLTFSKDGKTLFAGHADRSVSMWNDLPWHCLSCSAMISAIGPLPMNSRITFPYRRIDRV